jgi:flavin reductase (DIM6/NTAB) family NADH-FMN oxidoreductase RutF
MERVYYLTVAEEAMLQIKDGAFLTVRSANARNIMTIGWASIGIIWHKPVMTIAVRPTRHTFGLIEQTDSFTVSVPWENLSQQLALAGSKSGRDCDKVKECGVELAAGQKVDTPVVKLRGVHFECGILYSSKVDPVNLAQRLEKLYPNKDYHTLYYGEILDCYETK